MATIPQQLIEIAERAIKAGAKSGKECEAYTRKHAPDLAANHISHLYLAFKMLKNDRFAPAVQAVKQGAKGTLAQIAKPYQKEVQSRTLPTPRVREVEPDDELASALGLGQQPGRQHRKGKKQSTYVVTTPKNFKPPLIAESVYTDMIERIKASARKAGNKEV